MPSKYVCFFLFLLYCRVDGVPEDHEAVEQKLRHRVDDHGGDQHRVFVPAPLGQSLPPPDGEGREHQVVSQHLQHGLGHVVGAAEGVFPVGGEVEEHREHQGHKVGGAVFQLLHRGVGEDPEENGQPVEVEQSVQYGEADELDDPRPGGAHQVLQRHDDVVFFGKLRFFVHALISHNYRIYQTLTQSTRTNYNK